MSKARINSGHQRHTRTKTATPTKPAPTQVRTGFQALSGLNTTGTRQAIPHTSGSTGSNSGYQYKLDLAGVGKRGPKRMY